MKVDFTRLTFKRSKNYSNVLMQQGRVLLDAEWNEKALSEQDQRQGVARSAFGSRAAQGQAFRVAIHLPFDDCEAIEGWVGHDINQPIGWTSTGVVGIDHTVALQGRGSLRVAGADRVWKVLAKPLSLAGIGSLYFATLVKGNIDTKFSLYGNDFSQPLCQLALQVYQQIQTDQGLWVKYRAVIDKLASLALRKVNNQMAGYGFNQLNGGLIYHFDGFEMDFPDRFSLNTSITGIDLTPGRWTPSAKGKLAPRAVFDSQVLYHGRPALQVSGARTWQQTLAEGQDLSQMENLVVSAQVPKGAGLKFQLLQKDSDPITIDSAPVGEESGGWTQFSLDLSQLNAAQLQSAAGIGLIQGREVGPIHIGGIIGSVKETRNFHILGGNLDQGPLRFYLDGILSQLEESETYLTQAQYPGPTAVTSLQGGTERTDLVYLDVWPRHVTYREDPDLLEPALGGADTTTRLETVAQVKVLSGQADTLPGNSIVTIDRTSMAKQQPALFAALINLPGVGSGCLTVDQLPYEGVDNCLYRVEIHSGGAPGKAVFKWSKDNAIQVSSLVTPVGPGDQQIQVDSLGRSPEDRFASGDLLELSDDMSDYSGQVADLVLINGEIDTDQNTLPFQPVHLNAAGVLENGALSRSYTLAYHARLRRWDEVRLTDAVCSLGDDGVQVRFSGGSFMAGDYWTFAARTATHQVDALSQALPQGIQHHHCPLALVNWRVDGNGQIYAADVIDLRPVMDSLTELQANTIAYNDSYLLKGARNVQHAIESLAEKQLSGNVNCTILVWPDGPLTLQDAINHRIVENGGLIFLEAGVYVLDKPVEVKNKHDLIIQGSGATHLIFRGDPAGMFLESSNRVKLRDLNLVNAEGGIVLGVNQNLDITVENCTIFQCMDQQTLVHIASGQTDVYLDSLPALFLSGNSVFNLNHCRVVGLTGMEFASTVNYATTVDTCQVLANVAGFAAQKGSSTNEIHILNTVVQGWNQNFASILMSAQKVFRSDPQPSTDQLFAAIQTLLDGSIPDGNGSVATAAALAGLHQNLTINGSVMRGKMMGIVVETINHGRIANVEIFGAPSILANRVNDFSTQNCYLDGPCRVQILEKMVVEECVCAGGLGVSVGQDDEYKSINDLQSAISTRCRWQVNPQTQVNGLWVHKNQMKCSLDGIRVGFSSTEVRIEENIINNVQFGIKNRGDGTIIGRNSITARSMGIILGWTAHNAIIRENRIILLVDSQPPAMEPPSGILFQSQDNSVLRKVKIIHNSIEGQWKVGINAQIITVDLRIEGNHFDQASFGICVGAENGSSLMRIMGNSLINCELAGISTLNINGLILEDNNIVQCKTNAVVVKGTADAHMLNNSLSGGLPVVCVENQSRLQFSHNYIEGTGITTADANAIAQLSAQQMVVMGNDVRNVFEEYNPFPLHDDYGTQPPFMKDIRYFGEYFLLENTGKENTNNEDEYRVWQYQRQPETGQEIFHSIAEHLTLSIGQRSFSPEQVTYLGNGCVRGQDHIGRNLWVWKFENNQFQLMNNNNSYTSPFEVSWSPHQIFYGDNRILEWYHDPYPQVITNYRVITYDGNDFSAPANFTNQPNLFSVDTQMYYLGDNHLLEWFPDSGKYIVWTLQDKFVQICEGSWPDIKNENGILTVEHGLTILAEGLLLDLLSDTYDQPNEYKIWKRRASLSLTGLGGMPSITALGNITDGWLNASPPDGNNIQIVNNVMM